MKFPKLLLISVSLLFGQAALADTITYTATLTGSAENPSTPSLGTGTAVVTIDDVANTMEVVVDFTGLTANTIASHIHCCVAPPGNVGVATTVPTFTNFPLGATFGHYDHVFDLTSASSYNPAFVTAEGGTVGDAEAALLAGLAAGQAYLNIHTTAFPTGEIRGVLTTPEPSSLMLSGLGVLGLAVLCRGRRLKSSTGTAGSA